MILSFWTRFWRARDRKRSTQALTQYAVANQHRLAIVFRHHETLLFDTYGDAHAPVPILLDVASGSPIEDDLTHIQQFLFDTYQLDPDEITITLHYNCVSLKPMAPTTFSLSIVELDPMDFKRLAPNFIAVPANKLLLERETNLFFDMIAREYLDPRRHH